MRFLLDDSLTVSEQRQEGITTREVTEEFISEMKEYSSVSEGLREDPTLDGLLVEASESPIVFAKHCLGVEPYAWQSEFLHNITLAFRDEFWTKEFAAITSRQIGKSTSVAIISLWAALFNKYPDGIHHNTSVGIVSASDQQAKKLLYEIKKLIWSGDRVMEEKTGREEFFTGLLASDQPNNTSIITFEKYKDAYGPLLKDSKAGSTIKSYPPTSVVLGETFSVVIIDEAGKYDRISDEFFYDYIYPTGNKADAIRIYTSTPWAPAGFFYRMVDPDGVYGESPAHVVKYTVDALENEPRAQKQYESVMKTISQLNADGKVNEVRRAYYCEFISGEDNFFNPDDVDAMFTDSYARLSEYDGPCDLGVDFGGLKSSRTVITVSALNEDSGEVARLFHKTYEVNEDGSLTEDIQDLMRRFDVQRVIPDYCPAGQHLINHWVNDLGWNVQPDGQGMSFRKEKVSKYNAFRSLLRKGRVMSYRDKSLLEEMKALESSNTSTQSKIQAPRGYSDDHMDSFLLSCYFFLDDSRTDYGFIDIDDYEL